MSSHYLIVLAAGLVCGGAVRHLHTKADAPNESQLSARVDEGGENNPKSATKQKSKHGLHADWEALMRFSPSDYSRRLAIAALVLRATAADIPQLLKFCSDDSFARDLLLQRWVELDPDAAFSHAFEHPIMGDIFLNDDKNDTIIILTAMCRHDLSGTTAKIEAKVGGLFASFYIHKTRSQLLLTDMEAGIRLAAHPVAPVFLFSSEGDGEWMEQDPVKAARLLAALPPGEFRDKSLAEAMNLLAKNNLSAAIALQEKFPSLMLHETHDGVQDAFFAKWAKQDLTGMTAFLNDKAGSGLRTAMKSAIAKALGEQNPMSALKWTEENLSGHARGEAARSILFDLAQKDTAAALQYVQSLPQGSALDQAAGVIYQSQLLDGEYQKVIAEAGKLPEGPARKSLTDQVYTEWAGRDPDALLGYLTQHDAIELTPKTWEALGTAANSMEEGLGRLERIPGDSSLIYLESLCERHVRWENPPSAIDSTLAVLKTPEQRHVAIKITAGRTFSGDVGRLVEWGRALPTAAERQIVADVIETNGRLSGTEKDRLLALLR